MKKQFIETGEIVASHGIKGEVRIYPWSDSPEFLCAFQRFYLDAQGNTHVEAEYVRAHGKMVVAKLCGVDTLEDTVRLRGKTVYVSREDCPDDGSWFVQDLMGLEVRNADTDERYGTITDVLQTGANDVYQISEPGQRDKLVPAIPQVIVSVDIDAERMLIRPLEGLFDED